MVNRVPLKTGGCTPYSPPAYSSLIEDYGVYVRIDASSECIIHDRRQWILLVTRFLHL